MLMYLAICDAQCHSYVQNDAHKMGNSVCGGITMTALDGIRRHGVVRLLKGTNAPGRWPPDFESVSAPTTHSFQFFALLHAVCREVFLRNSRASRSAAVDALHQELKTWVWFGTRQVSTK